MHSVPGRHCPATSWRTIAVLLALWAGCQDPTAPQKPTATGDVAGQSDAATQSDTSRAAPDSATPPPDGTGEVWKNACAIDNGGCGDPAVYSCTHQKGSNPQCHYDATADRAQLVAGVGSLSFGGSLSSTAVAHGLQALVLAVDNNFEPVVVAARFGKGKVLLVGHEGQLAGPGDAKLLLANALKWMTKGEPNPVVALGSGAGAFGALAKGQGFAVEQAGPAKPGNAKVYVSTTYPEWTDAEVSALQDFVQQGGGLILGGHAWYWASQHDNVATDYRTNRVLKPMGITISDRAASVPGGELAVGETLSPLCSAYHGLQAALAHIDGSQSLQGQDAAQVVASVGRAIEVLPLSWAWYQPVLAVLTATGTPVVASPTAANPFAAKKQPIESLVLRLRIKLALGQEPALVVADPADFPGQLAAGLPTAGTQVIAVNGTYAGLNSHFAYAAPKAHQWTSTGLYLPPGAVATVQTQAAAQAKGLAVQVGCHTDKLYELASWPRMPELVRRAGLNQATTSIASGFGGLLYITVPPGTKLGPVDITIAGGAVAAPRFVLGQTTLAQWQVVREAPGPWAELEGQRIVLTVPSDAVRKLADPTSVLTLWDKVMDADADLSALPHDRPRKERIVLDREISAGALHSGYPIMGHLDSTQELADIDTLKAGAWGPLHELGHNHQWDVWVLPGTTESSVNLWSVYASEQVLGINRAKAHPALTPDARKKTIETYLATGPNFAKWSVWTALETYLQLQEAFGWPLYQTLFAEYLALSAADTPQTDAARIEQWVIRSSKAAKKNLVGFYTAWGLPISQQAKDAVANLPMWLDHPLAK